VRPVRRSTNLAQKSRKAEWARGVRRAKKVVGKNGNQANHQRQQLNGRLMPDMPS